eukprot:TRINITY_DN29759_c0_g2_i1.p1 TRINITY_DN29759_c0_g2~~TRINITY_DN29759_c0_g2_i1.p1  ORF type:complete len:555 (+),score=80.67 TRINITY_DN29759_c0_g2_i1:252-1667(+)
MDDSSSSTSSVGSYSSERTPTSAASEDGDLGRDNVMSPEVGLQADRDGDASVEATWLPRSPSPERIVESPAGADTEIAMVKDKCWDASPLSELRVCQNNITEIGARSLAAALTSNDSLLFLDARGNTIGDIGTTALSEALKKNRTLKELDLGSNKVSDWGARELGAALTHNRSLMTLGLCNNEIGDDGAAGLSAGLEQNGGLRDLDLRRNCVGDLGVGQLAAALEKNHILSSMSLEGNRADEAAIEAIESTVRSARGSSPELLKPIEASPEETVPSEPPPVASQDTSPLQEQTSGSRAMPAVLPGPTPTADGSTCQAITNISDGGGSNEGNGSGGRCPEIPTEKLSVAEARARRRATSQSLDTTSFAAPSISATKQPFLSDTTSGFERGLQSTLQRHGRSRSAALVRGSSGSGSARSGPVAALQAALTASRSVGSLIMGGSPKGGTSSGGSTPAAPSGRLPRRGLRSGRLS